MKTFTISLLLLFTISTAAHSQITFQKTYGDANLEEGTTVLPLQDGYLVTGSTESSGSGGKDVFAMKTDLSGNELWTRLYGGPQHDEAFSAQPTQDGGYIIAGVTLSYTGPSLQDFSNVYLLKIDSVGNLLWSKIINSGELDAAYSVKETTDHGFIITGYTGSFVSGPDNLLLVKTDSVGVTEWTKVLGSATNSVDIGRSVIQTRDGGYAVAGFSTAFTPNSDTAAFLAILNPAGNVIITKHLYFPDPSSGIPIPNPQTFSYDIIQSSNGNLLLAGSTGGVLNGLVYFSRPALILTDSIGDVIDAVWYSLVAGDHRGMSVKETANGGFILGGYMSKTFPLLLLTNDSLATQWCFYYGNNTTPPNLSTGLGYSVDVASDGGFILAGYHNENPGTKIHLIKVDSTGQSGCNQGIPGFQGIGSLGLPFNSINGTVFSPGFNNHYDVTSSTGTINFTDSVLCISTDLSEDVNFADVMKVHPNPAIDFINVTYENLNNTEVILELVDISGRILYTVSKSDQFISEQISLSKLNAGVYFLRAKKAETVVAVKKIIKS